MKALSMYGVNIVDLYYDGTVIPKSIDKFEAFMTAIFNSTDGVQYYAEEILKRLYSQASLDAMAFNKAVLLKEPDKTDDFHRKQDFYEVKKEMIIANYYAMAYAILGDLPLEYGANNIKIDITTFNLDNIISNYYWDYEAESFGKIETYDYNGNINVSLLTNASSQLGNAQRERLKELEDARDNLVKELIDNIASDVTGPVSKPLWATLAILGALEDPDLVGNGKDVVEIVNAILEARGSSGIPTGTSIALDVGFDFLDFIIKSKNADEDIEQQKMDIFNSWFGFCYGTESGDIDKEDDDYRLTMIRPDAYFLMQKWESEGIEYLIRNSEDYQTECSSIDALVVKFKQDCEDTLKEFPDLNEPQKNLFYQMVDGGSDFDLTNVNVDDFEECMKVLDAVIAKQDASKDINTFRDLWDNNINHLEINN